uniref:(California timema) hypothetical protein n=1 Tax=Timema californicum TaxID=61474 RepID=A0A7R9P342_TIMCA|nr:unnamed protein product [Timema californicum]
MLPFDDALEDSQRAKTHKTHYRTDTRFGSSAVRSWFSTQPETHLIGGNRRDTPRPIVPAILACSGNDPRATYTTRTSLILSAEVTDHFPFTVPKQNSIWAEWRQQKERDKLLSLIDTISTFDETVKNLSAELRTGVVDEVVLSVGEDSDLYCIRLPRLEFTHQDSNHRMDKYALQLLRSISSSSDFQQILSQDCPPLNTSIFVKKNSANFGVDWLSPYDGFPDTWDPANKLKLYNSVIEDVISGVRECFLDEGVDEQVLQELKQIWETKLINSKAVEANPEPPEPQPPQKEGRNNASNKTGGANTKKASALAVAASEPGNTLHSVLTGPVISATMSLPPQVASSLLQQHEPLNSGDDVSDDDPTDLFDTDNVVVCQYDKITRSRNKWKFYLKDGIMSLGGKDYVFQKANGDAEW